MEAPHQRERAIGVLAAALLEVDARQARVDELVVRCELRGLLERWDRVVEAPPLSGKSFRSIAELLGVPLACLHQELRRAS